VISSVVRYCMFSTERLDVSIHISAGGLHNSVGMSLGGLHNSVSMSLGGLHNSVVMNCSVVGSKWYLFDLRSSWYFGPPILMGLLVSGLMVLGSDIDLI